MNILAKKRCHVKPCSVKLLCEHEFSTIINVFKTEFFAFWINPWKRNIFDAQNLTRNRARTVGSLYCNHCFPGYFADCNLNLGISLSKLSSICPTFRKVVTIIIAIYRTGKPINSWKQIQSTSNLVDKRKNVVQKRSSSII